MPCLVMAREFHLVVWRALLLSSICKPSSHRVVCVCLKTNYKGLQGFKWQRDNATMAGGGGEGASGGAAASRRRVGWGASESREGEEDSAESQVWGELHSVTRGRHSFVCVDVLRLASAAWHS